MGEGGGEEDGRGGRGGGKIGDRKTEREKRRIMNQVAGHC